MNYLKIFPILSLALGATFITSCGGDDTVDVTAVNIVSTPSPLVLTVGGEEGQVSATVLPSDATDKTITWSIAPEGVATVSTTGVVSPVAVGTATITATAAGGVIGTCSVTVNAAEIAASGSFTGTFTVAPGTASAFSLEDATIEITANGNGETADMVMKRVRFAEMMPSMDITVPGISLEMNELDPAWDISGEGIVPTAMGGPFSQYTITGLTGQITARGSEFSMMCGPFPVAFTGTRNE